MYNDIASAGSSSPTDWEIIDRAARLARVGKFHDTVEELRDVYPRIRDGSICLARVGDAFRAAFEDAGEPEGYAIDMTSWIVTAAAQPGRTNEALPQRNQLRRSITVEPGTLTQQITEAETEAMEARLGLFQRAGSVVRLVRIEDRDARGDETTVTRMIPVTEHHLAELLEGAAEWVRHDRRSKCMVATGCPVAVPRAYLARAGAGWRLPHLKAIINTPTLRRDGSVFDTMGYDRPTRLFYDPCSTAFPEIPDHPSDDQLATALADLRGLLAGCAFVDAVDESVALAAILTALVRSSLPTAPMFAFTASTAGTGKSYISRIATNIAFGRAVGGLAFGVNEEENRKQIDSAVMEGRPVILFDNVEAEIRGARLAEILTEPEVAIRPLGQTAMVDAPCAAIVMATGNNLTVAADMTRRVLLCRLDRRVERPELHHYETDALAAIAADRGRYVAAALILMRGFISRGRPHKAPPLGSYEAWSDLVRGTLLWVGMPDPVASVERVREGDPRRGELQAVLSQWHSVIGTEPITGAQLIERASSGQPEFREALLAVAGVAGAINTQNLGRWLRGVKGRIADGMHIEPATMKDGVRRWSVHGGQSVEAKASEISLDDLLK